MIEKKQSKLNGCMRMRWVSKVVDAVAKYCFSFAFTCGWEILLVFRFHIRLRSHKGFDNMMVTLRAGDVQRCASLSIQNDEYEEWEVTERWGVVGKKRMRMHWGSKATYTAAKNYLSFAFTSDFAAKRAWTTARWPWPLASCRGVLPFNMCIVLHRANAINACGCAGVQRRHIQLQRITCLSHSHQTSQPKGLGRQQGGLRRSHSAEVYIHSTCGLI